MSLKSLYVSTGVAIAAFSASGYLMSKSLHDEVSQPDFAAIPTKPTVGLAAAAAPATASTTPPTAAASRKIASVSATAQVSATRLPQEFQGLAAEIKRLQGCYESECGYPRSYPRDYDFAVGRELKKTIYALQAIAERDGLQDETLSAIARENLSNEDGHVKEAALHLLATQPTSEENLQSILRDVIEESDAELIEHAMLELQRYKSPDDLKVIRGSLAQAMLTGAPFVSEAVSKNIVSFIDNSSYAYFSEIATRTSPGSRVKLNLQFSLLEFRRRSAGA